MALKERMWIIFVIGLVGVFQGKVTATPGRVGCFYDLQLCEANELCYNDSLFGTCVAQLTDAVSYENLTPEALTEAARVLQYLIETGYKWPDSYTQCVVGKYLQSAVNNEPYDPQVCEYLKQILSVIDQARNDPSTVAGAPRFPQSTDVQAPVEPLSHGEFMTKSDGKADFDVRLMDAAPSAVVTDTPAAAPISIDDAASYAALQQYLQTLAQQQPEVPVNIEKKSGPTEATTPAPENTPTIPPTNISDQALQSDAQAFDNLFAFLSAGAANADAQLAVAPQSTELTAVPMDVPEVVASDQQPMPMRVPFGPEMNQQDFRGAQFVPDFNAPPPPGMFNNMDEMLLAQQMVAAQFANQQNMPQIDPRMLMDMPVQMDPRMMQQIDPRMIDPRMMDPRMMDPRMLAQMDPRMMAQMDPRMMQQLDPRMMSQIDPRIALRMDPRMMSQIDPRMIQMDTSMMDSRFSMPQMLPDQFPFGPVPTKRGDFMAVPPMDLFYNRQPPPMFNPQMMDQRMFDPRIMPPQMPPMEMFTGFPPPPMDPNQWAGNQLQMQLPAGFAVIEPVLVDTNTSDEAIKRLFAESGEQSGDAANGSDGPSAQSKKDQEYKSLLPSNENLQAEVVEDVTVKIVKGSLPDAVVPSTDAVVIKGDAHDDDEYVFLMTEPQLSYEEARFLLNWLRAVLSLPVQTFYDLSVTDALVTFRINPALQNLNATYIAQTFGDDELRSAIRGANGLQINRAGVGRYRLVEAPGEVMPLMQFEPTAVVESMEPEAVTAGVSKADKEMARKYDVLDPTMAFIVTDPPLDYKKARELLIWLAGQLQVPHTIFTDLHIEGNQLVFRVTSLFNRINASRVVEHLSDSTIQSALRQQFDVEIIRAGIGDKVQVVKADLKQRQNLLIGLIAVACVAAILITLGIIYFVRRNLLIKKKLQGLGGDVESSKEYEVRRQKEKEAEAATLDIVLAISQAEAAHAPVVKTIA